MPEELDSLFPQLGNLLHADWDTSASSSLTADPEHGGVTAESLDAWLKAHAGTPLIAGVPTSGDGMTIPRAPVLESEPTSTEGGDESDDEEEPDEGQGPPPAQAPPPSLAPEPPAPSPAPDDAIEVDGQSFTRAQVEAFARFSHSLDTDPALQQLLTAYYTGRLGDQSPAPAGPPPPVPAPAPAYVPPPAPPSLTFDPDVDDPRLTAMAQLLTQQQQQIAALSQATQTVAQQSIVRSQQEAETVMNRAAKSFQEQHSLSDEEVVRLRKSAARLGHLDALMSGIDPITGAPSRPDLLSAVDRALEIAMYADPTIRQRTIDAALQSQRERNRKRQKLAGVGGGSGSVSRTPVAPTPGTANARSAMVDEVAAMMSGTWQEPGR